MPSETSPSSDGPRTSSPPFSSRLLLSFALHASAARYCHVNSLAFNSQRLHSGAALASHGAETPRSRARVHRSVVISFFDQSL